MRIGIICEGPTDEPAITNFLKASLTYRDITPEFVLIQPDNDRTKPSDGGWHAVLNWLLNNPPKSRIATYLSGGLFDDGLSAKRCDVLVFQMDSDILSKCDFQNWTRNTLGYGVTDSSDPIQRGKEVRSIIGIAGKFETLSDDESKRHIPAPAVESTEAWCVAVYGSFFRRSRAAERARPVSGVHDGVARIRKPRPPTVHENQQIAGQTTYLLREACRRISAFGVAVPPLP